MTDSVRLFRARQLIREWLAKQGQDRCWYYPDIFNQLAAVLGVEVQAAPQLPPRVEFEAGCRRYQDEQYRGDPEERSSSAPPS